MLTNKKHISIITLIVIIGIIVVGLGIIAFNLKLTVNQEIGPNVEMSQPLRGIVTHVELGKDGVQVELQTDDLLYSVTISQLQTKFIGNFDQIVVGAVIEVSGQEIAGMDPPLIVADTVRILGTSNPLTGNTWILTAYNDHQPIKDHQPTLKFETDQVSGTTGCNHFGGTFQIDGDTVRFEGIFSTEMGCMEPEGIMEQERIYLELLRSVEKFELSGESLTFYAELNPILVYKVHSNNPVSEDLNPTPAPGLEPLDGYNLYQDTIAGISVNIPENWIATGVIEGQYAVLQSYPEDKYIGGEPLETEDTKCDLAIRAQGTQPDDLIEQWKTDGFTTIISENDMLLNSGQAAKRYELDSMGLSTVMITEIDERVVVLSCFGNRELFDEIAMTLSVCESYIRSRE